ncbi:CoA-binding protein [Nitrosopumilus sp.]|jgi:predicted CoA-binding protein|nr:CoA-binding protein [Nitrosopumilus sp.]MDC0522822.1 CoA-binding protein [Nitrosopumilus sp.]MDC0896922.1 CoA-binding protein [Nitrosopumilus sp.]MDC1103207.1 CoA-binding protein [Nitrosopumilus sp.]MDC3291650.1 CoA-binding protein [Nitrosopumilus sp.]|tara:strand:+ start:328 stop:741 length:414 start_codon:yes stop_codon:yes gene_type:complete
MNQDSFSDHQITDILSLRTVAVIGMSKHSSKAAHYVPKYLIDNGYDVTPVNPNAEKILNISCYDYVSEIEGPVDIIDVFRPSEQISSIIRDCIEKKPKVIWLQEGIHDFESEELARKAGILVVFNRCMLAEHMRLGL